jgi:hypothetical protein
VFERSLRHANVARGVIAQPCPKGLAGTGGALCPGRKEDDLVPTIRIRIWPAFALSALLIGAVAATCARAAEPMPARGEGPVPRAGKAATNAVPVKLLAGIPQQLHAALTQIQRDNPSLVASWVELRTTQENLCELTRTFGFSRRKAAERDFTRLQPKAKRGVDELEIHCERARTPLERKRSRLEAEDADLTRRMETATGPLAGKLSDQSIELRGEIRNISRSIEVLEAMLKSAEKGQRDIPTEAEVLNFKAKVAIAREVLGAHGNLAEMRRLVMDCDADIAAFDARKAAGSTKAGDEPARARLASERARLVGSLIPALTRLKQESQQESLRLNRMIDRMQPRAAAAGSSKSKPAKDFASTLTDLKNDLEISRAKVDFCYALAAGTGKTIDEEPKPAKDIAPR